MRCILRYARVRARVVAANASRDAVNEVYIDGCLFFADDGPPGSTGLVILGAEHVKMSDCRMDSFTNGILITPNAKGTNVVRCTFTSVAILSGTDANNVLGHCVLVQPQVNMSTGKVAQIAQITFNGCSFEMGEGASPVSPGPGHLG